VIAPITRVSLMIVATDPDKRGEPHQIEDRVEHNKEISVD
jgi:hypothetical protein